MSPSAPALDENEKVAAFMGTMVAKRYAQRRRQFPHLTEPMVAGIAASDVFLVLERSEEAHLFQTLDDLFALEEPM